MCKKDIVALKKEHFCVQLHVYQSAKALIMLFQKLIGLNLSVVNIF